jgi:hypothetical protein
VTWSRKKRRRKLRKIQKEAEARRPWPGLSPESKEHVEELWQEFEAAFLNRPELEGLIPQPDDDGPGGLHDVDLSLPGD